MGFLMFDVKLMMSLLNWVLWSVGVLGFRGGTYCFSIWVCIASTCCMYLHTMSISLAFSSLLTTGFISFILLRVMKLILLS